MGATTKRKLIRVIEGLYRSESGDVRVYRLYHTFGREERWVASYTTVFGSRAKSRFRTLAEVREWLNRV